MKKEITLHMVKDLLSEMKKELMPHGYKVKLIGGLKERGFTTHDIDLDISMLWRVPPMLPDDEVFDIISGYSNELWEKYRLELDVNFLFKGKAIYKFDKDGLFEYQVDGSLQPL